MTLLLDSAGASTIARNPGRRAPSSWLNVRPSVADADGSVTNTSTARADEERGLERADTGFHFVRAQMMAGAQRGQKRRIGSDDEHPSHGCSIAGNPPAR